jgi:hypothetical protein
MAGRWIVAVLAGAARLLDFDLVGRAGKTQDVNLRSKHIHRGKIVTISQALGP